LTKVSLKWTWRAVIMIAKEIFFGTTSHAKKERQFRSFENH
jgi:hypothetical protein